MDEAEFCGRLSIMHRGKIVAKGRPLDLIREHHVPNLEQMFIKLISQREKDSRDESN
jgi:ribosome-dependent ATPase